MPQTPSTFQGVVVCLRCDERIEVEYDVDPQGINPAGAVRVVLKMSAVDDRLSQDWGSQHFGPFASRVLAPEGVQFV